MITSPIQAVEELAATLPLIAQAGLLFDATGRLLVDTTSTPEVFANGLPLTHRGALCVTIYGAATVLTTAAPTVERYLNQLYDEDL